MRSSKENTLKVKVGPNWEGGHHHLAGRRQRNKQESIRRGKGKKKTKECYGKNVKERGSSVTEQSSQISTDLESVPL